MRALRRFTVVGLILATVLLSACGSKSSSSSSASGSNAPLTITIKNFAFSPATLNAKVGDTITVKNEDSAPHSVTATDHSFDTGVLNKGQTATIKVDKAGTENYICSVHNYMTGVIQVS
jgi:plastocyanin